MNKFVLYATALVLGLSLAACGSSPTGGNKVTDPVTKPTNTTAATPDLDKFLNLINQFRSQPQTCPNGAETENMPAVAAVAYNAQLNASAKAHSEDMAANNYFEHTGLNGSSFSQRNTTAGYTGNSRGENIAAGQDTEQAAFDSWRTSTDGHCQGMMQANIDEIGFGYGFGAASEWKHYWTFVSGRKN